MPARTPSGGDQVGNAHADHRGARRLNEWQSCVSALRALGLAAWTAMAIAYRPTTKLYRLAAPWLLSLPLAAALYAAMTVDSAIQHRRGAGGRWKGRVFLAAVSAVAPPPQSAATSRRNASIPDSNRGPRLCIVMEWFRIAQRSR
jgi:hypothetical protein